MSLDRSLKSANSLQRHRNVLSRAERMERLQAEDRWSEGESVFALPKVANRKAAVGTKTKAKPTTGQPEGGASEPAAG